MNASIPETRPCILVVDDEVAHVETLCDILHHHGYSTTGCTSGAEALQVLAQLRFDILLTDLMMPGMDGIALLRAAVQIDPAIVVLIMTGAGTIPSAIEAMKAGAVDYILKPLKPSDLLPVLSRAQSLRRLRMDNNLLVARPDRELVLRIESPFHRMLFQIMEQTMRTMAGMVPELSLPHIMDPNRSNWSWVTIVDPRPAMVVIGMDLDLADEFSRRCLGDRDGAAISAEIHDAHAELTNVVVGSMAQEAFGNLGLIAIGVPRTGRGLPILEDGALIAHYFQVNGRSLTVYALGFDVGDGKNSQADPAPYSINDRPTVVVTPPPGDIVPIRDRTTGPVPSARLSHRQGLAVNIGHYRIIDQIGVGGMGVVYKAHHDTLDRLVALKVMRPEFATDQQFIDRFLREGRASATIDHPNVVPVYDAGFEEGLLFLAMRFVPGGDLATLLHHSGALPEERSLLLTRGCLEGLGAIADANMIHRDIKPANILLEASGIPRLADLGLVRSLLSSQLSQPGAPQGTPAFMSPEQARATRHIDIRCDIYSMGVTLYCMVTGELPFKGESSYDIVAKVLYHPVPDPRWIRRDLHDDTAGLIMKAMAKGPGDRFQTPQEFQHAVEAVIQNHRTQNERKVPAPNNYWVRKLFKTPRPPG